MSFPHSKPFCYGDSYRTHADLCTSLDGSVLYANSPDRVIDEDLKNVPLPVGLMSRLKSLVGTLTDEVPGNVDYLGC